MYLIVLLNLLAMNIIIIVLYQVLHVYIHVYMYLVF